MAAALGLVLVVAGLIIGAPKVGIEGAYFNRSVGAPASSAVSVGAPASSAVFAETGPGVFDPADGNLWIGAGLALVVVAAIAVGVFPRRTPRPVSE